MLRSNLDVGQTCLCDLLILDILTILIVTLILTTLLIMTILITLNTSNVSYNDITYNWFYFNMALLITVNKKQICNVAFINVISKVITS